MPKRFRRPRPKGCFSPKALVPATPTARRLRGSFIREKLLRLRVRPEPAPVQLDARLIAGDLGIVTGRDIEHVAGIDLHRGPVVQLDRHGPGEAIADVVGLAGVGLCDRLDVLGPLPAGLEHALADRMATDVDDFGLSFALKGAGLIRRIEVPDLTWHPCSFRRSVTGKGNLPEAVCPSWNYCFSSKALLRHPGGFERLVTVGEPFPAEHPSVAEREHNPEAPGHACSAGLAPHLSQLVRDDLVSPGIDELAELVGALLPGVLCFDEEVPYGFSTLDGRVLGPLLRGNVLDLRITDG